MTRAAAERIITTALDGPVPNSPRADARRTLAWRAKFLAAFDHPKVSNGPPKTQLEDQERRAGSRRIPPDGGSSLSLARIARSKVVTSSVA